MNILKSLINFAPVLVAGAFLYSPPAFGKSEPISLVRTGKWVADYDVDSCHLAGAFGHPGDPEFLILTQYEPRDSFYVEGTGKVFRFDVPSSSVTIDFGPAKGGQEQTAMSGSRGNLPTMIVVGRVDLLDRPPPKDPMERLPTVSAQDADAVNSLTIAIQGLKPVRLETGSMAAPMRALRACTNDLVRLWGHDPQVQENLSRRATPVDNPGSWITVRDYPIQMLLQGGQGLVRFRLSIDETGAVTGCRIQQRINPDAFADLSCRLLTKRAKFAPALDSNGRPVKSYYVSGVRWIMEQ